MSEEKCHSENDGIVHNKGLRRPKHDTTTANGQWLPPSSMLLNMITIQQKTTRYAQIVRKVQELELGEIRLKINIKIGCHISQMMRVAANSVGRLQTRIQ